MLARWRWREPHVRTHSGAQRLGVLLAPGEIAQVARARVPRQVGLAPPLHLRVLGGRCVRRRCAAHRAALDAIRKGDGTAASKLEARRRYAHINAGHVPDIIQGRSLVEVTDGKDVHLSGICDFSSWDAGEAFPPLSVCLADVA